MVTAIVGANWGDEGKGKITDMLAETSDIAGHTIINDYGKFALHTLPSGVFYDHTTSIIGNGVALDIPKLFREIRDIEEKGVPKVAVTDLARDDIAEAVEDAFRYDTIVFATTTFNNDIFPFMKEFINSLTERNFQNKRMGFIENGSWAPQAMKVMKGMLEGCKNMACLENEVSILSGVSAENEAQIEAMAEELAAAYK